MVLLRCNFVMGPVIKREQNKTKENTNANSSEPTTSTTANTTYSDVVILGSDTKGGSSEAWKGKKCTKAPKKLKGLRKKKESKKFIKQSEFLFFLKGGQKGEDLLCEGLYWEEGLVKCKHCDAKNGLKPIC
eukprot:14657296-Ditylum_brightwellii.AAC.1